MTDELRVDRPDDIALTDYQAAVMLASERAATMGRNHFVFFGGVATGKSRTGAQWAIDKIIRYPELTGLIGANSYDQLSQATLRELFEWLDRHEIPYVIDQRPPREWGVTKRQFKKYTNILSLLVNGRVVTVFTRVMSEPNPLRGTQFSWYWIDEARDTPEDTHKVIMSRMRESKLIRGLITTTTNGDDWTYAMSRSRVGASVHVPTVMSVERGIITREFYEMLLAGYDELLAAQELHAKHVNVKGGRAYHATGEWNVSAAAPWGDEVPNPERPLIVGCDFNFDPAPMVWVVGQLGPVGTPWEESIHWFREIANRQTSTREQARELVTLFGIEFFYQVYGDASGGRGTTSNAGEHDFNHIADELTQAGASVTVDYDQANPLVFNRVANVNAKAKNALGHVSMTYDKDACPHLHEDFKKVGWKKSITGRGRLDDGGNHNLTHAGDAVGYALWKVLPYGMTGWLPGTTPTLAAQNGLGVEPKRSEDR